MPINTLKKMVTEKAVETANTLTVGSIGIAAGSWLTDLDAIIHIIAGVIAIAAGLAALYFHILNIKKLKDDSKEDS